MKEYLIGCEQEKLDIVYDQLKQYKPIKYELIPYYRISVDTEQEQSLLEALATIPNITFREALMRKALPDDAREKP